MKEKKANFRVENNKANEINVRVITVSRNNFANFISK